LGNIAGWDGRHERPRTRAGRAKPWKATWRDGRQRSRGFEREDQARAFDALPTAAKTVFADGGAGDIPAVPAVEIPAPVLPEGVFAYETGAGTR
jgi:hypothetical protein